MRTALERRLSRPSRGGEPVPRCERGRDPLGYGAEIVARIADECLAWLDAPIRRVASADTFVGYPPRLEDAILPQVEDVKRAVEETARF